MFMMRATAIVTISTGTAVTGYHFTSTFIVEMPKID